MTPRLRLSDRRGPHGFGGEPARVIPLVLVMWLGPSLPGTIAAAPRPNATYRPAEREVIEAVKQDKVATFVPKEGKPNTIRATFLKDLLLGKIKGIERPPYVYIRGAEIRGKLDLSYLTIRPYLWLRECKFHDYLTWKYAQFEKGLTIWDCVFQNEVMFQGLEVKGPFECTESKFHQGLEVKGSFNCTESEVQLKKAKIKAIDFSSIKVAGSFDLSDSEFRAPRVWLTGISIGGDVKCDDSRFHGSCHLYQASIGGNATFRKTKFCGRLRFTSNRLGGRFNCAEACVSGDFEFWNNRVQSEVSVYHAHFKGEVTVSSNQIASNLRVSGAKFHQGPVSLEHTRVEGNFEFDEVSWPEAPDRVSLTGLRFAGFAPFNACQARALLSRAQFAPDVYSHMEGLFRSQGRPTDADSMGVARAKHDRSELPWWYPKRWGSFLAWLLVGNGYHPGIAFIWAAAVIAIGYFVFRPTCMAPVNQGGAQQGPGLQNPPHYSPLWYSFDLFVPAIDFKMAAVWAPTPERRYRIWWMRTQKILGWFIVPIAVLAWAGFVKP